MMTVGVLVLTTLKDRHTQRGTGGLLAVPKMTIGFSEIIRDAMRSFEIKYITDPLDKSCEYVLASLVSWYDVYNLIVTLGGARPPYKLVIGGPGVINVWPLAPLIWAACVGRAEGLIERIIAHDQTIPNVWYRDDPVGKMYSIGQATRRIGDGREYEGAIGCPRKCYFCEYGWKYQYQSFSGQYEEYRNNESFFSDVDFKSRGSATAGIDGLTERERYIVNKPLSTDAIIEKLGEHRFRDNYRLKLFVVTAYPFTDGYDFDEWAATIERAAKIVKNKITIMLSLSHFCPMPFTPMEEERVLMVERKQRAPTQVGKIKWMTYLQGTTYSSAAYESLLYRGRSGDDVVGFVSNNAPSGKTAWKIADAFPHVIEGGYIPAGNIVRPYNVENGKRDYKRRIALMNAIDIENKITYTTKRAHGKQRKMVPVTMTGVVIEIITEGVLLVLSGDGKKEAVIEGNILRGDIPAFSVTQIKCKQKSLFCDQT